MTTKGMSYGDRNGLQDESKKPNKFAHPPISPGPQKKGGGLPNVILCFKKPAEKAEKHKTDTDSKSKGGSKGPKRSKSRELRNGILYVGCDCERRNGLQDDCPRSECQGAPECLTVPPTCLPSEFAQGKHITRKVDRLQKERAEFANRNKGKSGGGSGGKDEKVDYDCFPLDEMMKAGLPCPICDRTMEACDVKTNAAKHQNMGPMVIDFPSDCCC